MYTILMLTEMGAVVSDTKPNTIMLNDYLLAGITIAVIAVGAFGGYYFTNKYFQDREGAVIL